MWSSSTCTNLALWWRQWKEQGESVLKSSLVKEQTQRSLQIGKSSTRWMEQRFLYRKTQETEERGDWQEGYPYLWRKCISSVLWDDKTTVKTEVVTLKSSQEETDSRLILYTMHGKEKLCHSIRVKSPDSDIFFILQHHVDRLEDVKVMFDIGMGNKKMVIDLSEIATRYV